VDPFQVLGLDPDASIDEAEDAYRRQLLIHHPDLHHDAAPDLVAGAHRTTRELNDAIARLRARDRTAVLAGASATTGPWWATSVDDEPVPDETGADETGDDETVRATVHDETRDGERVSGAGTWCPMCGAPLATGTALRTHVAAAHDVHLDPRLRPQRRRRRRRPLSGLAFHSPWALLPVNALAALVVATAAGQLTHDLMFARWTFVLGMAPTIIRTLTRGHD
jgi:curved DNA-binding protein CbpA